MLCRIIVFFLSVLIFTPYALAENEGLSDLDRATEIKIAAQTQHDLTEAIELCQSALNKGLDERNSQFARRLMASTLCERATLASDAAFAKGPSDPLWRNYRSLALKDLEEAVALVPELPDALLIIARLDLLPDGDQQRANEAIQSALAIKGIDPQLRARFVMLSAEVQKSNEEKIKLLSDAIGLTPNKIEPLRERGMLYAKMGKNKLAAEDFAKVLELDPKDAEVFEQQAEILAELKRYDEALVCVDKASQLNPRSAMPLAIRAQIHARMDNLDAALLDLNQALTMRPGNPYLLLLRASLYKELNKPDSALADIDRVLLRYPTFEQARRLRWSILISQHKFADVIADMEKILKKNPNDLTIQLQIAMLCTVEKQPQKAIEVYSAILAKKPDNLEALEGRGNALLGIGKHAEAIVDFNKAMKLESDDSGTLNNLAWVLATSPDDTLRDGKRAVELATKACELTQFKQAHIISTLAAAYAESGNFAEALKWVKKAIEVSKTDDPEILKPLQKELKNYEQGKPTRERLDEGLPPVEDEKSPSPK